MIRAFILAQVSRGASIGAPSVRVPMDAGGSAPGGKP